VSDIKFNCPQCGTRLSIDASGVGLTVGCPNCSKAIVVPPASSASPAKSVASAVSRAVMNREPAGTKKFVLAVVVAVAILAALAAFLVPFLRKPSAASAPPSAQAMRGEKQNEWVAGSLDTSFNVGTGGEGRHGEVYATAFQPDGKLVLGGRFSSVNGTARRNIARLNSDGTLDTNFDPGAGADSLVGSIVLDKNGDILIGGGFTSFDRRPRAGIARLHGESRSR